MIILTPKTKAHFVWIKKTKSDPLPQKITTTKRTLWIPIEIDQHQVEEVVTGMKDENNTERKDDLHNTMMVSHYLTTTISFPETLSRTKQFSSPSANIDTIRMARDGTLHSYLFARSRWKKSLAPPYLFPSNCVPNAREGGWCGKYGGQGVWTCTIQSA